MLILLVFVGDNLSNPIPSTMALLSIPTARGLPLKLEPKRATNLHTETPRHTISIHMPTTFTTKIKKA